MLALLLEFAALAAFALWASDHADGFLRIFLILICVVVPAAIWAVFRMPNDGGAPVVEISGRMRLVLETVIYTLACFALLHTRHAGWALIVAAACLIHYALGYDRVIRMLGPRS